MAVLRFRLAYIIVAVLRSTALRRVVEHFLGHHHELRGESSSSLHPGLNTVRPRPSSCGRCVLTPGPRRLLMAVKRRTSGASRSKQVKTSVSGNLDIPFHIIAGTVGEQALSG